MHDLFDLTAPITALRYHMISYLYMYALQCNKSLPLEKKNKNTESRWDFSVNKIKKNFNKKNKQKTSHRIQV